MPKLGKSQVFIISALRARANFAKLLASARVASSCNFSGIAHLIRPSRRLNVTADRDDNIFIECADEAGANYLITGNLRHFPRFWKKFKIVTCREFLDLAAPHLLG